MKVDCLAGDEFVAVKVEGDLQRNREDQVADPIEDTIGVAAFRKKLLVDLTGSHYLDTTGVCWLLVCHKRCKEAGGVMVIHSCAPMICDVLRTLRLDRIFNMASDEAAAKVLAEQIAQPSAVAGA